MQLVPVFKAHACRELSDALVASEELEEELLRLVEKGRSAWSRVQIPPQDFVAFIARHLPAEAAQLGEVRALCAHELYLVCAYGAGNAEAAQIVESQYLSNVRLRLLRLGTPNPLVEDILQELRIRLADMQRPEVTRRGYSGRSALLAWLTLSALRESRYRQKLAARELSLEEAAVDLLPAAEKDPELAQLIELYKNTFYQALRDAVAALTTRQRNLLRHHYIDKMNIDDIGQIYRVHRATAARWIARAQEQLIECSREMFLSRIPMGENSLTRVLVILESQIHLSLGKVLVRAAEVDLDS